MQSASTKPSPSLSPLLRRRSVSNGVSEMLAASPPAVCQQDLFLGLGSVAEHGDVKVAKGEKTEEEEEEDGEEMAAGEEEGEEEADDEEGTAGDDAEKEEAVEATEAPPHQ